MATDWTMVALGEALEPTGQAIATPRTGDIDFVGVRLHGGGVYKASTSPGVEVKAKKLVQVVPGAFIYNRMWATRGTFATVPSSADGMFVTNEYPQFVASSPVVDLDYLALVSQQSFFLEQVDAASVGSTDRRRLHPSAFLELEIDLPPIDAQRQIVAAAETFARVERTWKKESAVAKATHTAGRIGLIENSEGETITLREIVVSIKGGKSPKCLDRPPADGEYGVLKVSAIRDGEFRADEAKALPPTIAPWAQIIRAGDLLYSRANTSGFVGTMCMAETDFPDLLLCDKTMRVKVDEDRVYPHFLVEAIGTPSAREHIELMAGGTSESMKNISQASYLETEIVLPPLQAQRQIAKTLNAIRQAAHHATAMSDRVGRVRRALVEELVTGVRTAPLLDA
jgi:type I restriction enzyme S subunit